MIAARTAIRHTPDLIEAAIMPILCGSTSAVEIDNTGTGLEYPGCARAARRLYSQGQATDYGDKRRVE
jgi:hypothetical protein